MTATVVLFDGRDTYFEPRRSTTLDAALRRTRTVGRFRVLLALAMAVLAGVVGAYILANAMSGEVAPAAGVESAIEMINPRFTGRDSNGSPYVVTADTASRRPESVSRTELANPKLVFEDRENPDSAVTAERGVFDRDANTLDLYGKVRFETDNGYLFETEHARVRTSEGVVMGDAPISGSGPMGALQAQSFQILERGSRVVFDGNVVARINVKRREPPPLRGDETTNEDAGP